MTTRFGLDYQMFIALGKLKVLKEARVLGNGYFDWIFIYLVLIPVSCFVVLFSVLFRLQQSVVRPNRSQVVRIELPCISVS